MRDRRGVILGKNHAQPVRQRQELVLEFGWMDSRAKRHDENRKRETKNEEGFSQAPRLSQIND
jgi:hypothetical protein